MYVVVVVITTVFVVFVVGNQNAVKQISSPNQDIYSLSAKLQGK